MPTHLHRDHATAWNTRGRIALRTALAQLDAAEANGQPHSMTQALTQLGRCYRELENLSVAAHCFERAIGWAGLLGAADSRLDLLCELAETTLDASEGGGSDAIDAPQSRRLRERSRDLCFEASRLAARTADPQWEVTVLLRVSDVLDRCGDHDDAIALQCRALQLIARHAAADAPEAESEAA